ncbi:hypothetical protein MtrunA17_Chr5g0415401 [Medicago truncatula]|uniref:Uncharacterized protein n=1 Tax=Medicago truncatula TaxID=3880 RepID=A0A396HV10_MEDTR|nr:hypothetical protein MtrunA17_Chr5g0415401 [Medicago truncatula]
MTTVVEHVSLGWFPTSCSQISSHLIFYHSTNPRFIFTFRIQVIVLSVQLLRELALPSLCRLGRSDT